MASMRVGRRWLKKTKRTRLPRLDTIPRRSADRSEAVDGGSDVEIVVDLSEGRTPATPE
jgi:hypothetical protein